VERSQQHPWVQVIGQIAVRRPGREPQVLTGASRVLLAVLVAAGPGGAAMDEIAGAYWRDERPSSWRVALRVSASHLTTILPSGWKVTVADDVFRLVTDGGFVDAWRLEQELSEGVMTSAPSWLSRGRPFDGISGIGLVDRAAERIEALIPEGFVHGSGVGGSSGTDLADPRVGKTLFSAIRHAGRAIVTARAEDHAALTDLLRTDSAIETHLVIGDRGMLLPLGPFAMTFPDIRNLLHLEQGAVPAGAALDAFRAVADSLSRRADERPQQLVIARTEELDATSLQLVSLLASWASPRGCSLVVMLDPTLRDLALVDFVRRARDAGCEVIEVSA